MAEDGDRNTDELRRLREKREELEETLGRLRRDEAEAEEVVELTAEVEELEDLVEQARSQVEQSTTEKTMTDKTDDVRKAAHANVAAADRQLDALAKGMMTGDETFEKAYDRALDTQMGRALLRTRDDAQAIATGGATEADLEAARESFA